MFDDPLRELDLLVAKYVMGWKDVTYDGISCTGVPPVTELKELEHKGCGINGHYHVPRFISDANADYKVLCKVRECWCTRLPAAGGYFPFYGSFLFDLKQLWFNRKCPGNTVPSCYVHWEPYLYQIGDYSRAALESFKTKQGGYND